MYNRLLSLLTLMLLSLGTTSALAETITGRVVGVADGGTLTVLDPSRVQHKIRMVEIDAPESKQPYGSRSKQVLSELVYNKQVSVKSSGKDRYGRVLGRVYLGDLDVNREMVRLGSAWAYREYLTDKTLLKVEAEAKASSCGLWGLPEAERMPPQEWRRKSRSTANLIAAPAACGTKHSCKEMVSCEEAKHYLVCGVATLDGDGDGMPCEALCR